jgi:hypothetical protein
LSCLREDLQSYLVALEAAGAAGVGLDSDEGLDDLFPSERSFGCGSEPDAGKVPGWELRGRGVIGVSH